MNIQGKNEMIVVLISKMKNMVVNHTHNVHAMMDEILTQLGGHACQKATPSIYRVC